MAADEKTIYEDITDHFFVGKKYDMNDVIDVQPNYRASILGENKDFIYLGVKKTKNILEDSPPLHRSELGQLAVKHELKFHISIPEDDEALHKRAIDVLIPVLMKHHVNFKFLKKGLKMTDVEGEEQQAGRDITIYAKNSPDKELKDWTALTTEITEFLVKNDIPPGYLVTGKGERKITGCNYVTYRYEKRTPRDDPIKSMVINIPCQKAPEQYIPRDKLKYDIMDKPEPNLSRGFGMK